jgi:hypothetical protein
MIAVYSGTSNQVEVSRVNGSDEIRLELSVLARDHRLGGAH